METPSSAQPAQAPGSPKDPLEAAQERLGPRLDEAKQQLTALNVRVKAFVKENPGTSLLGALALGYVVGRLVSKK